MRLSRTSLSLELTKNEPIEDRLSRLRPSLEFRIVQDDLENPRLPDLRLSRSHDPSAFRRGVKRPRGPRSKGREMDSYYATPQEEPANICVSLSLLSRYHPLSNLFLT